MVAERDQALADVEKFKIAAAMRDHDIAELDNAAKTLGIPTEDAQPSRVRRDDVGDESNFKDLAVHVLKKARRPMRAAEIQAAVERLTNKKFHPKTAGMTLYRLSKDYVVSRHNWDWHYVPEAEQERLRAAAAGFTEVPEAITEEDAMEE